MMHTSNMYLYAFLVSLNIIERCGIKWQATKIGTASEKRTICPFPQCPLFRGSIVHASLLSLSITHTNTYMYIDLN